MKPITVLVSACGAPGTAALMRALRANGEREVRIVGTDMGELAIGRHLADAFHRVPAGSDAGFADAMIEVCRAEGVEAVLPQSSFDLLGLAEAKERFEGIAVLVSSPESIHRSNDKAETYALLDRIDVRGPTWRRVSGGEAVAAAARELGYPDLDVCMKPVFSSGSRGFRVLSASADRHEQLLSNRPGVAEALRLEDLLDLLGDDPTELLVMELATGKERTIDGIAVEGRIALGHPKTREAMRAGLAMYFETLDDPELMETAQKIVAELRLDHFFNIQLVGEHVIEINPRISTIVYQEDLNLPYLGVKHALGEISEEELGAHTSRIRPTRRALRFFDQVEWDTGPDPEGV
jgi:carbamoyl-phosphate synthase large subunit